MTAQQLVQSWTEWCRSNLDPNADLPINKTAHALGAPWAEHGDLFKAAFAGGADTGLFDCLSQAQAADPADIYARFPAIHLCRCFLTSDASPLAEDLASPVREQVRSRLELILGFLKPDECPADWRVIKFEILASFVLKNWERARRLYDFAEHAAVLEKHIVHALRGQFSFLVALYGTTEEDVVDDLKWEPRLLGCKSGAATGSLHASGDLPAPVVDRIQRMHFFLEGIRSETKSVQLTSAERESLRRAIHDLEVALDGDGASVLSPVYRCILARSYFELGDDAFSSAAKHYRELLHADVHLLVTLDLKGDLYLVAARSARLAGQTTEAQRIIDEWQTELPADAAALRELAELQEQEGHPDAAAQTLWKASRLQPEPNPDLYTRVTLAWGGIGASAPVQHQLVAQLSEKSPEVWGLIDRICTEYWPPFAALSREARDDWKAAIFTTYWLTAREKDACHTLEVMAIPLFAGAVEMELKWRMFAAFKRAVAESPELRNAARSGGGDKETRVFCGYLVSDGCLTLGQMATILRLAERGEQEILTAFRAWLARFPRVIGTAEQVDALSRARNLAVHEGRLCRPVEEIHRDSREIINRLYQAAPVQP
jgi:tetratricopeptide (TPR) repeat protein